MATSKNLSARSYHGTLDGAAADTVVFQDTAGIPNPILHRYVAVVNRAATGDLYVLPHASAAATVAGDGTFVVLPGERVVIPLGDLNRLSLIAASAVTYSVIGQG